MYIGRICCWDSIVFLSDRFALGLIFFTVEAAISWFRLKANNMAAVTFTRLTAYGACNLPPPLSNTRTHTHTHAHTHTRSLTHCPRLVMVTQSVSQSLARAEGATSWSTTQTAARSGLVRRASKFSLLAWILAGQDFWFTTCNANFQNVWCRCLLRLHLHSMSTCRSQTFSPMKLARNLS